MKEEKDLKDLNEEEILIIRKFLHDVNGDIFIALGNQELLKEDLEERDILLDEIKQSVESIKKGLNKIQEKIIKFRTTILGLDK